MRIMSKIHPPRFRLRIRDDFKKNKKVKSATAQDELIKLGQECNKMLTEQVFQLEHKNEGEFSSVTGLSEILPLWHNFKSLGQSFEGLFSIWKKFDPTVARMFYYWASFQYCRWPKTLK